MRTINWRDQARDDLRQIISFIADLNPIAAERLLTTIEFAAERLAEFPEIHWTGRLPGTREAVVHPNYLLVYSVGEDRIDIVAVIHARRQYPPESES